jgi:hypothetical protein
MENTGGYRYNSMKTSVFALKTCNRSSIGGIESFFGITAALCNGKLSLYIEQKSLFSIIIIVPTFAYFDARAVLKQKAGYF